MSKFPMIVLIQKVSISKKTKTENPAAIRLFEILRIATSEIWVPTPRREGP